MTIKTDIIEILSKGPKTAQEVLDAINAKRDTLQPHMASLHQRQTNVWKALEQLRDEGVAQRADDPAVEFYNDLVWSLA